MDESYNNRMSLVKGAKDIAKEAKRHAAKKVSKIVNRATDEYSSQRNYSQFQNEDKDNDDMCYTQPDSNGHFPCSRTANDEDGEHYASDATEGHDDEDEIYEGEYQGVPAYTDRMPRDGQDSLGQPVSDSLRDRKELELERQADEEELAQQYELIMQECGHGRFQWQLFFVLGMALMSDGVEVFVVGFVLPSAETDMCVPNSGAGWLGSIVYLGMMVGAFFWGGLSDKVGRKQCLLIAMSVNGFFSFLSSFVQGYGMFLFCRMFSGFGIGGAVPIVFPYFAEFLAREKRGEHLSWLCMFWMIGGIYASAMAWLIIPHYGWSFSMGSAYQFHSWRVFVVVCVLPCVCAVVALTFMPESPRFLLEMGKHDEAWMVLKQIHDTNMRARGEPEKVFTVNRIKLPKHLDELVEMQSDSSNPVGKVLFRIRTELRGIWLTFMSCFNYPVKDNTIKLAFVWFTLSFGYYGLSVWFPDVIHHLQSDEYASRVKTHNNEHTEDFTFNFTLENQIHTNGVFVNDRFISMKLKSVTFIDSTFQNCYFDDVSTVGSLFKNCTFVEAFFYNTGGSMVLSGISCFFLWFGTSESMMIFMLCLYNGLSISAWNSLDVVTAELYPTDRRGTGFGFCNAMCKLAAVLGNLIFGSLVGITKTIPILLASAVLVGGGLVGLRLPDTRGNVLM
ncbi:synaptic vesicle glycoprotein 2C-like isoform X2 [Salvelinus namaycush]|uniref:Synaptic vesicle glycoprotein 2C-like isoform X2 n=1 Tax=Salvelinus namaycush TaxID=8040 RepID=A0A8U0PL83_SALNM|nr:synaptic vesicle glycoprotein 2C-like isoform X2 [Salvelinus namaycush]